MLRSGYPFHIMFSLRNFRGKQISINLDFSGSCFRKVEIFGRKLVRVKRFLSLLEFSTEVQKSQKGFITDFKLRFFI